MSEPEWVELMAARLRDSRLGRGIVVETGRKLVYAHEITSYGEGALPQKKEFRTDLAILERLKNNRWKPRVIVEAKIGNEREGFVPMTHDAITYSQKAAHHRAVHPYLRYGIMLGNRRTHALPGRLYRHGAQFDFMISFGAFEPSPNEMKVFVEILRAEVKASRTLEKLLYETKNRDRDRFTVLHRKLIVGAA